MEDLGVVSHLNEPLRFAGLHDTSEARTTRRSRPMPIVAGLCIPEQVQVTAAAPIASAPIPGRDRPSQSCPALALPSLRGSQAETDASPTARG